MHYSHDINLITFWTSEQGTDALHLWEMTLAAEDKQRLHMLMTCQTEDSEIKQTVTTDS